MKRLAILLFAALSAQSFAMTLDNLATSYSGKGTWKGEKEGGGAYTIKMNVEKVSDTECKISEEIKTSDETMNFEYSFRWRENSSDWFDVVVDNADRGTGYCFTADSGVLCHYNVFMHRHFVEKSFHVSSDGKKVETMGSKAMGRNEIAWKDTLTVTAD